MASTTSNCHNSSPINPAAAAMVLGQFDQKTQLQALALLRQLNAQQQLQQIQKQQQLQQLQQLQALQALQKIQLQHRSKQSPAAPSSSAGSHFSQKSTKYQNPLKEKNHQSCNASTSGASTGNHSNSENNSIFAPVKRQIGPDGEQFIVPSADMTRQIMEAAEYYFSDENLAKDHYLLRQICQKSEGFLSIKLLTALKNVKRLTKDWRVTSYALEKSNQLILNDEKTKVKRIAELPEQVLKARQITNVIGIKIPAEFSSVSAITQLFAAYGKITLVRVLLPGRPVPCDLRNYATQVPDMGNTLCTVVEYETESEACNACRELNTKRFPSGMRAALLGPRLRRNLYKIQTESTSQAPSINSDSESRSASSGVLSSWSTMVKNQTVTSPPPGLEGMKILPMDGGEMVQKRDSGCDSSRTSSPPVSRKTSLAANFDRAPGAGRKSVRMMINVSSSTSGNIVRQPRGPTGSGLGFLFKRSEEIGL